MYSHAWNPVLKIGTYRNPIIFADYSDPDVIQHGMDVYMVNSNFRSSPGVPVLH